VSHASPAVAASPVRQAEPREVPLYIPSRGEVLGAVLTLPEEPSGAVGVVLVAGRARDRAHRNGMWVRTAHQLAEQGLYALRLDYPGVGNSSGPPKVFPLERSPAWAVEDACRFLLEQTPIRRILLVGTCYGSRLLLDAAPLIAEVEAVMFISGPIYTRTPSWKKRLRVAALRVIGLQPAARKRRLVADPEDKRPQNLAQQRREGNEAKERRVSPVFARSLRAFLSRGRIHFLYGDEDFTYREFQHALRRLKPSRDRYDLEVVPGIIHTFQSVETQDLTIDRVVSWCARAATEGPRTG
jgi:pimeloyl-ACP methyl ester carboxylesterase